MAEQTLLGPGRVSLTSDLAKGNVDKFCPSPTLAVPLHCSFATFQSHC